MSESPTSDPAFTELIDFRAISRAVTAALPGAVVLIYDRDLRVRFAEGDELLSVGLDAESLAGQLLPAALSPGAWANLEPPFTGALEGSTSTVDIAADGVVYSVHVSPVIADGRTVGGLVVSHEMTEQRRLESLVSAHDAAARDSERFLATAFDRAPIGMSVIGLDGRWLRVNQAYGQMLGYEPAELLDRTFRDLTHPEDVEEDVEWMRSARAGESASQEREKRYLARDGSIVWAHVRSEVIGDDEGHPAYIVSQLQDITQRRSSDLSRRETEQRLRAILDNTPASVSVKGPDHRYQLVNRAFEQRLNLEPGWMLGRLDEEILAPSLVALHRETDDLVLATGELVEREEVVPREDEDRVYLTLKFPLRDEEGDIYAVCAIVNDITERKRRERELEERVEWTDRIHGAVLHDRLVVHAQPIVDLASGEIERAELLVRMLDHQGSSGVIAPGEFLPAAERFDLISVIDLWVVARGLELASQGHCVEINLSGKTISKPEQVAEIERQVLASGALPANVIFEITETAAAEDLDSARRFAERMRRLGCSFALDDFGVGFGTFTYLKHLPVDYLKIDIEFVRDLVSDEIDRQVVKAIVGVARDFGMKTIAEGVEDQATLELLVTMGVDYAQGYWIGRPAPIGEAWPTTTGN